MYIISVEVLQQCENRGKLGVGEGVGVGGIRHGILDPARRLEGSEERDRLVVGVQTACM